jgi:hypothetical protein
VKVADDQLLVYGNEIVPGDRSGGPSTSQTIMVESLDALIELLPPTASADAYRAAVIDDNLLGKRTAGAREWAFRQLRRFYALDTASLLFRALRDLWPDPEGRPLLALLCAMARDPVLRASAPVVLASDFGTVVGPDEFEKVIEDVFPGAYRASTRRATARKLASSWQQAGHLEAVTPTRKVRTRVTSAPSAVAYALLLGHLQGVRGVVLLDTPWARVLDQPASRLIDLGVTASQRGMLEFRHAGGLIDVGFRELLRPLNDGGHTHP